MMCWLQHRGKWNCRSLIDRETRLEWLKACVAIPLVAVLLSSPSSNVSGPWWLELSCVDDEWTLWAIVPFCVDEDGALGGEGTFVLLPTAQNDGGVDARGIIGISGRCAEDGFDLDAISFPSYELGGGDSLNRRLTALQLDGYESSWDGREALEDRIEALATAEHAEILAQDGAEARFHMAIGGTLVLVLHQGGLLPLEHDP